MFTPEERARLRSELLDRAASDSRITGAAITGSAAVEREDCWSDIDLAFAVGAVPVLPQVVSDWTAHMYGQHQALHHHDIKFGAWIYRVFLLPGTLQVDLAFVPAHEFRPLSPSFRLVFGIANEPGQFPPTSSAHLIGMGWLYALHARACIARGHLWQAEYMIRGMRDQALALACVRYGVPAVHGRGIDQLPGEVTKRFEDSLIGSLDTEELSRAFKAVVEGLLIEISGVDESLAVRLQQALTSLTAPSG